MTISVIIPCFNSEAFIGDAIASVLSQNADDLELIVVDDGSTDHSANVITRFPTVKLMKQKNQGVSVARNNGAKAASGSFLLFLDADDRLHPGALNAHLEAMSGDDRRVLVSGVCDVVDRHGSVIHRHRQAPASFKYWDILLGVTPNPSQCMIRRNAFDKISGFDESLAYGEDWECFLRLSQAGECYCHGAIVADYRKHDAQSTRRPSKILSNMLAIMHNHAKLYVRNSEDQRRFEEARRYWIRLFGKWIPGEAFKQLRAGRYRQAAESTAVFLRLLPNSAYDLPAFVKSVYDRETPHTSRT